MQRVSVVPTPHLQLCEAGAEGCVGEAAERHRGVGQVAEGVLERSEQRGGRFTRHERTDLPQARNVTRTLLKRGKRNIETSRVCGIAKCAPR